MTGHTDLGTVLQLYALAGLCWLLVCFRYSDNAWAVVFACLVWPVDLARRLAEGARDWWQT